MGSVLEIKKITDEFEEKAKALILQGFLERFGYIDERYNPDLNEILSFYGQEGRLFIIGLKEGQLVGTGGLIEESERTGRIVRMSVLQTSRRKGIAEQLLGHLEEKAKEQGFRQLVLETNKDWESAIRFYQKMRFQVVQEDEEMMHFFKQL
ncbi:MAG TPA: GNAT family N-acetyltransferase [Candidatus Angelobacter sp.]|nr:GNAT family N-acetyltransferase [Candidatus Angelobacter sp.]